MKEETFSLNSKISDVIRDEAFSGFGRLLFPSIWRYRLR